MTTDAHRLAQAFIAALSAGDLPDTLLTDDMQVWTTSSRQWGGGEAYQGGVRLLGALFPEGYRFTVHAVTAEDDRAVIEAEAEGRFGDGVLYTNTYVFIIRHRGGKIASVAEHFDPTPVREVFVPRMQAWLAARPGG